MKFQNALKIFTAGIIVELIMLLPAPILATADYSRTIELCKKLNQVMIKYKNIEGDYDSPALDRLRREETLLIEEIAKQEGVRSLKVARVCQLHGEKIDAFK